MGQKSTPIECMPFISLQNSVERSLYKGFYAAILSITSQKGLPRYVLYISQNQQIVPAKVRQNPVQAEQPQKEATGELSSDANEF